LRRIYVEAEDLPLIAMLDKTECDGRLASFELDFGGVLPVGDFSTLRGDRNSGLTLRRLRLLQRPESARPAEQAVELIDSNSPLKLRTRPIQEFLLIPLWKIAGITASA
jgi:hypothetical protein